MLRATIFLGYVLTLFGLLSSASLAHSGGLTLLPRSEVITSEIQFDARIRKWLAQHPVIKVGVWGPPQPPIFMNNDPLVYEGLGADYLHVLERALDVKIEVQKFDSATEAQQALRNGEVDILGAFNPDLYPVKDILSSSPWLLDHSALITPINSPSPTSESMRNQKLSYIANNSHQNVLNEEFPGANLKPEEAYLNTMTSVAWGQSRAAWVNRSTAEYLLTYGFTDKVKIANSPVISNLNLSFGVSNKNPLLLRAINESLGRVPLASRIGIANRWGLSSDNVTKANPLALTAEEQNWLRTHPEITVLLDKSAAPNTFVNKEGKMVGAAVDLMNTLSARYGLKFKYVVSSGRSEMVRMGQRYPDALYGSVPEVQPFETTWNVLTTRPYILSPLVLLVAESSPQIADLYQLRGRKIAITTLNPMIDWFHQHYPGITIVSVRTLEEGYAMLKKGQIDAVATNQFSADYMLVTYPNSGLRIGINVGGLTGRSALGANPENPLLISIMNKALIDLPPENLHRIYEQWQPHAETYRAPSWRDWRDVIIQTAVGVGLIVLLLLLWNRQIHRVSRQRESARRALSDQLAFVSTLLDSSPIALYVLDREKRMVHANPALRQTLNDEAMAEYLLENEHLDQQVKERLSAIIERVIANGEPEIYEGPLKLNDIVYHVYHWVVPWRDANGSIVGVIGGWLDITEKEKLVNALRTAKDEADLANESKSVFLSSMSHEIRTPMNAIIGLLELEVKDHQQQGINNENVRVAWESAKSLLLLIGDILDLSKIESGTYQLRPTCIELPQLVKSVVNLFENRAREKDLALALEVELDDSCYLLDPLMITQIVSNLVSNAIKFTDSGSVSISVYQSPINETGKVDLVIEVSDTGPGLTLEQQQRIFAPFVQVEGRQARLGTGLGLSICRRLAELMSGELQVESEPGDGASFAFYFSAETCEAEVLTLNPQQYSDTLQVLIVDDHSPNRLLLSQQLEMMGHQVIAAEGGDQALAIVNSGEKIDLIITDITMPGMDGFELTRFIRQHEQQHSIVPRPILGLTAHAQSSVTKECLASGMTDCLFKPVRSGPLQEAIHRLLGRTAPPVSQPAVDEGKRQRAMMVLNEEVIRTNRSDVQKLELMIEQNDRLQIAKMAHRLLGGARIMQENELEKACEWLENISNNSDTTSADIKKSFIKVAYWVDNLEQKLKSQ
ncbi:ATP-binding protein [Pantoea endophytica]